MSLVLLVIGATALVSALLVGAFLTTADRRPAECEEPADVAAAPVDA